MLTAFGLPLSACARDRSTAEPSEAEARLCVLRVHHTRFLLSNAMLLFSLLALVYATAAKPLVGGYAFGRRGLTGQLLGRL